MSKKKANLGERIYVKVAISDDMRFKLNECQHILRYESREDVIREAVDQYMERFEAKHGKIERPGPKVVAKAHR